MAKSTKQTTKKVETQTIAKLRAEVLVLKVEADMLKAELALTEKVAKGIYELYLDALMTTSRPFTRVHASKHARTELERFFHSFC